MQGCFKCSLTILLYFVIGEPPLAPFAKTESEWQRQEVESSLRKWFKFMVVSDQWQAQAIRTEWRTTFDKLPADDDVRNIDPKLKPKWAELPKRVLADRATGAARTEGSYVHLHGISSALENPPVNPITGCGRSSTEVQRELQAYRAWQHRIAPPDCELPAVFMSDYLFVQLPFKPLMLMRVVHDCNIDEATSPHLSFTAGQ